jgi:lipopolysaccharide assembly outer membrane protein LptD (OstA)
MTNRLLHIFCAALAALTASAAPLLAQGKDMGQAQQFYKQPTKKFRFSSNTAKKDGTVKWTATKQEVVKDEFALLEGEVKVFYQDIILNADKITYNLKTKDAVAEGHVVLDQGASRVSATRVIYNLDSQTGTFFNATGTFEPSINFTGEKMEKTAERTYRITNGTFTSCDLDQPPWSFHIKSGVITLDDYAHLRGLEFKARRIPLFYTPYLVWPTKRDRSRGFLIPRIGYSQTFGSRLELGYFMPFGESVDVTANVDLHSKSYLGAGIDVRYLPSQNVKVGELQAYTVHDGEGHKQQWKYKFQHAQDELPYHFRGVVDMQDFSDLDFFRRFDKDPALHTLSNIYSSAYLTKNRSNYSINLLADRRDIFLTTTLKQRFEQLPSLQFRLYPNKIGETPFYLSVESSASHLRTSGLVNGPSADYYRTDVFPTLSMQLKTPSWFSIRPEVSVRETWYSSQIDADSTLPPSQQQALDKSLSRFYGQAQVEVVGPSFSKIFNREVGNFSRFKHVIEPRVRYLYTTSVSDQEKVIRFDTVDTPYIPLLQHQIEYSLTQRLIGKEKGPLSSSREIMSFSLRQSASLGDPYTTQTSTGVINPLLQNTFSPLTASLHVNPYQSITLDANTTFGNVSHQVDQTSFSANILSRDRYLGFTWFASFQQPNLPAGFTSSQLRLNAGSPLWHGKLRADAQLNYDAKKHAFLEQRYLIGGTGSCYSLSAEYRRYFVYDVRGPRQIWGVDLAITLKNVGTINAH